MSTILASVIAGFFCIDKNVEHIPENVNVELSITLYSVLIKQHTHAIVLIVKNAQGVRLGYQ